MYQFTSATKLGHTIPLAQRRSTANVSAPLLSGGTYSLANDASRVVVLNYWASDCGPCRIEMPGLEALHRELGDTVAFVGVNTKDASPAAAKAFVNTNGITYPIVSDEAGKTAMSLGHIPSTGLPFPVVLDKHHRVAAVYLGLL